MALVDQELDYPDNKYEGNLGVDDKEPELKWAVPGHSAVPELFNWLGRKTTEDLQRIRGYLDEIESVRKLTPLTELMPVSNYEPDIIYINGFKEVFSFSDYEKKEVGGVVNLVRTEPQIVLRWSSPNVETATSPSIEVEVDITGKGDEPGQETISTTQELTVPTRSDVIQESVFDLGDVSKGDENDDGWDDVRGNGIQIFVSRDPLDDANGEWHLHSVEVR